MGTSGLGAIGTPEACAAQIERLWQQSKGGFGASLAVVIPQHLARGRIYKVDLLAHDACHRLVGVVA